MPPHPSEHEIMAMQEAYKQAEKQQPRKAEWVAPDEGKRLLLLDLDKTIIFYDTSKGFFVRPHLATFLATIKDLYSVYIFTAANKSYATAILNDLKRSYGDVFKGLLWRENCTGMKAQKGGKKMLIKDIRIITGCSEKDILVVDDYPWTYCLNPENALRVTPFEGNQQDRELLALAEELK